MTSGPELSAKLFLTDQNAFNVPTGYREERIGTRGDYTWGKMLFYSLPVSYGLETKYVSILKSKAINFEQQQGSQLQTSLFQNLVTDLKSLKSGVREESGNKIGGNELIWTPGTQLGGKDEAGDGDKS